MFLKRIRRGPSLRQSSDILHTYLVRCSSLALLLPIVQQFSHYIHSFHIYLIRYLSRTTLSFTKHSLPSSRTLPSMNTSLHEHFPPRTLLFLKQLYSCRFFSSYQLLVQLSPEVVSPSAEERITQSLLRFVIRVLLTQLLPTSD